MLVFIDDSGDPGFKVGRGSTRVFVVALVIFDDDLDAEETSLKIKRLRRQISKYDDFEFKFNKCSKEIRCKFLRRVAASKFRVRAIVVPKSKIYSPKLRDSNEYFYNHAIKLVLKHHGGTIKNAKIFLDGHGPKKQEQAFLSYLRREINPLFPEEDRVILKLKIVDSRKNPLIQLADMVAGAIYRSYNSEKNDSQLYRRIIRKRLDDVWDFA